MTALFFVRSPGPYTTIQDRGRFDWVHMGVPISGAVDDFAYAGANQLVGNPEDLPALEITLAGTELEVLDTADIAMTGAEMQLTVNGRPAAGWRTLRVKKGDRIATGMATSGCRAYLSATGGISVPEVMGSCSTYVGGRIGGLDGRPLHAGDILERGAGTLLRSPRRMPWFPIYSSEIHVRAIPGPQDDCFTGAIDGFFAAEFKFTDKANRMGCRLEGPFIDRDAGAPKSIISEASFPGNIQIPPDGRPIILMVEQTIGGYTKIATVITPDLFQVAQAKPGDRIRFHRTSLEEAGEIHANWTALLAELRHSLESGEKPMKYPVQRFWRIGG